MRAPAILATLTVLSGLSGCVGPLDETSDRDWLSMYKGAPAALEEFAGTSSGQNTAPAGMAAAFEFNDPGVTCTISGAHAVECLWDIHYVATGGDSVTESHTEAAMTEPPSPSLACDAPANGVCAVEGKVQQRFVVTSDSPEAELTFRGRTATNTELAPRGEAVAERTSFLRIAVRFDEHDRPVPTWA